jgi:prephenate dehydrogenase
MKKVKIVGAGLIGTSIALGLKSAGYEVTIEDEYPEAESIAQSLIGQIGQGAIPEIIVVATPISTISSLLRALQQRYPESMFIDVGGLKSELLADIEHFPAIMEQFCPTHPMAGREIAGALAARADLFQGRIWIYTPTEHTSQRAISAALEVIQSLGGVPVELTAKEHDEAIAGISHLPQVVSSLLSVALENISEEYLMLAGPGLKDVSRLAASNPQLWSELLHSNRKAVSEYLRSFAEILNDLSTSLINDDLRKTHEILSRGRDNHRRIPGKHLGKHRNYWYVPIVIDDKPGQLARIFDLCAEVSVNVEDLGIEHSPGQETGLVTLAVSEADSRILYQSFSEQGWKVHLPRESIG